MFYSRLMSHFSSRSASCKDSPLSFLGTPHKGLNATNWRSRLEPICQPALPNESLNDNLQIINTLRPTMRPFQNIDRQSIHLSRSLHIFFFHEGKPIELGGGKWEYTVEEQSASPNIQDVESAVMQKDHAISTSARVNARPDSRLSEKPIFSGNFPQDDYFISREHIFAEIERQMDSSNCVSLCGWGGVACVNPLTYKPTLLTIRCRDISGSYLIRLQVSTRPASKSCLLDIRRESNHV